MKLTLYKKILGMTKEAADKTLIHIRVAQAKKQGELKLMEIEERILKKESNITEITTKHPLDFDTLIKELDDLGLLERRKKQFEKIIKELFESEE